MTNVEKEIRERYTQTYTLDGLKDGLKKKQFRKCAILCFPHKSIVFFSESIFCVFEIRKGKAEFFNEKDIFNEVKNGNCIISKNDFFSELFKLKNHWLLNVYGFLTRKEHYTYLNEFANIATKSEKKSIKKYLSDSFFTYNKTQ